MTASVIHISGHNSTVATASTTRELASLHAQQAAENALSMALHYLRSNADNVPGATRKAMQALAALRDLSELVPTGANRSHTAFQGI